MCTKLGCNGVDGTVEEVSVLVSKLPGKDKKSWFFPYLSMLFPQTLLDRGCKSFLVTKKGVIIHNTIWLCIP